MPTEPLNGVHIFYARAGSGPPLVLVHGSWGDHHNWDLVAPALAREFDVVRYDRRGHSQSGPESRPGTADDDVDDLFALIERLGLEQPIVIGNSFGALIALKAAARNPKAFRALVIHEPPLTGLVANDPIVGDQIARTNRHFEQNIASLLDAGRIEDGARVFVETVAFGPGAWEKLPRAGRETFMRNALTWRDELRDPDWSVLDLDALRTFDRPVLITNGTESAPFFKPIVEKIAPALPRGERFTYQGSGHVPHATHADVYLATVLPFLRRVAGTGPP